MNAAEAAVHLREVAGRRARDEAQTLDRLVESMRLASFRGYLASTVVSMSALVPDALATAGFDVPQALQRLRPAPLWPSVTAREAEYGRTGPATNRMVKVGRRHVRRPAPFIGDAIIREGVFGPVVEAKVFGGSLDVIVRDGAFELSTQDGTGYLRCDQRIPDTALAAAKGRPLCDLVDHPLLRRHPFVVEDAAFVGKQTSVSFDVGRLDLEMPWRD